MRALWDVPVLLSDGVTLRADVFLPTGYGTFPVLVSFGPYGKGLHMQDGYPVAWDRLLRQVPSLMDRSSCEYMTFETPDPEVWVAFDYVCVRVDSRGAGRSEGVLQPNSPQDARDLAECIEWAASQEWSTGKIGLSGISYLAEVQWKVAMLAPPELSAICPWEGAADYYRDVCRHGGILSTYEPSWYDRVAGLQNGAGMHGARSRQTGRLVCGDKALTPDDLRARRVELAEPVRSRSMWDGFYAARSVDWSRVNVPFLSAANWGGQGLHSRGNFEGFWNARSTDKWLTVHTGDHLRSFYSERGVSMQRAFFDCFLKGEAGGWMARPRVEIEVRTPTEDLGWRTDSDWPLADTVWRRLYLDAGAMTLVDDSARAHGTARYLEQTERLLFRTCPMAEQTEVTGPIEATLTLSSTRTDCDVFLTLRVFDPDGNEHYFESLVADQGPLTQGWLRASHRDMDSERSRRGRPFHSHTQELPLAPGEVVELKVELWPAHVVLPKGWVLGLEVSGSDFQRQPTTHFAEVREMSGSGRFLHNDLQDRHLSADGDGPEVSIVCAMGSTYLDLPIIMNGVAGE